MKREKTLKRNALIYKQFLKGMSKDELAKKFDMTRDHVITIISSEKSRNNGTIEEEREKKARVFNWRLEKFKDSIELGDVIVFYKKLLTDGDKQEEIRKQAGEVIYKNSHFVTLRGELFTESFLYGNLQKQMISHFK